MKHLYIISRPFAGNTRGTGEQVVTQGIYNALQEKNIQVSFMRKYIIPEYGSILSILFYDYIYSFYFAFKSIFQRPNVVIFASPYQGFFMFLYKLFGNTTILICHDAFYTTDTKTLFNMYTSLLYKNAFYFADSIITTSEKNKTLMDTLFHVNTKVIPLGVERDILFHSEKNNYASIGYIGKYDERKRVNYILELLKLDIEHTIEFVFAGDMPDEYGEKIKTIRPKLNKITLLGYIWGKDKNSFYEKIHFLYFPTSNEGFGIPIIESFQAGVIPIVHNDADIPETLKEHCIQIEHPQEILGLLEKYKSDKELFQNTIQDNHSLLKDYDYKNYADFLKSL